MGEGYHMWKPVAQSYWLFVNKILLKPNQTAAVTDNDEEEVLSLDESCKEDNAGVDD